MGDRIQYQQTSTTNKQQQPFLEEGDRHLYREGGEGNTADWAATAAGTWKHCCCWDEERCCCAGTRTVVAARTRIAAVAGLRWWWWRLLGESWKWGECVYDLGMKGKWWGVGFSASVCFPKKKKKCLNDIVLI